MDKLNILWTNADETAFDKMVAMYARNAKVNGWWNEITVLIWGSTARLAAQSELAGLRIRELLQVGVGVVACKSCSDSLGTTEKLQAMGVDVRYLGEELTRILKSDEKLLTV
ncbi:MAG TPA: DsrE family protein [Treponemataceae bacterium]|nr:DsrE family protein [Treponemataceae bacterium]HPS44703.1 DsrE family protein [Treponemataceae bacterium]